MTIKEKAEEYRSDTFRTPFGDDIAMAYSEGAEWMLNKLCDWIENQMIENLTPCMGINCIGLTIEQIRKAMEE